MGLIQLFQNAAELRRNAGALANTQKALAVLKTAQIQLTRDYLLLKDESTMAYKGNAYGSYADAVVAIDEKYNGVAAWGTLQTGNIIDIRAAFIIAEGVQVSDATEDKSAEAELEFATAFLSYNDLDREMAQDFAKEAELEGKILIRLVWDKEDQMVMARYVSWLSKRYEVTVDPNDYTWYRSVGWRPTKDDVGATDVIKVEEPYFVYKKFGGRVNRPNDAAPKLMKCLTQVEDLDKALRDLREIDRLFAAPVLVVKFDDPKDAAQAQDDIDKMNWKIKKALCTTGEVSYVQPDSSGVDGLVNEITNLAKVVSGATGVPVHFLGLPDLMSNRATAENLMDLVYASTLKERQIWIGAYKEMLAKAMAIYNEEMGLAQKSNALDVNRLAVDIPFVSEKNWSNIKDVFVPLALGGLISKELLLSKIPGVNVADELDKDAEDEKNLMKKPKEKTPPTDDDEFTDEGAVADEDQPGA